MLKRRVTDPIKFVFEHDGALAPSADGYDAEAAYGAYLEGYDLGKLRFVEGQRPTVFVLQGMTNRQRIAMTRLTDSLAVSTYILRCGLLSHEGYEETAAGGIRPVPQPERVADPELGMLVTEKSIDDQRFTSRESGTLANVIIAATEMTAPLLARSAGPATAPVSPGLAAEPPSGAE